jgi:hypothetical protein
VSDDPQKSPLFIAQEALNFYAYNTPDRIKEDGGAIARETLQDISLLAQMADDPDTCNHIWILDKSSEVVRIVCAKCGKVMNP